MKLSTNEVTLIGFVGGDPQAKETKNHNKYVVVSLATTDSWKDKNGDWQKRSTWHRLVGWQAVGESMIRNLGKGAFIQVRGSIRNYEVPAKDGQGMRTLTEIVVTGFAKLDRNRRGEAVPETEGAAA
jgi:single-strand DNA-binding protein